eukprot:scaffold8992_cov53-Phaeocystis_antarctica.AAC.1
MRTLAHILRARCFWRSCFWLRSWRAIWAAVLGLGTACARAGAGFGRRPATCWAALGALAPAPAGPPGGCAPCAARASALRAGRRRLAASASQSSSPPTTPASRKRATTWTQTKESRPNFFTTTGCEWRGNFNYSNFADLKGVKCNGLTSLLA